VTEHGLLDELAAEAGIEPDYADVWGARHALSAETKLAFLDAMGIPASNAAEIASSLVALRTKRWRRALEPVTILPEGGGEAAIGVVAETASGRRVAWQVTLESGARTEGRIELDELPAVETTVIDGKRLERRLLALRLSLPLGYHSLELTGDALIGHSCAATLIVAPERAYLPARLQQAPGLWGFALQLYGLQGRRSSGIGDFADLAGFAAASAELGAGALGLNPLHALFPGNPAHASPYSPSSRCFLNPLYINAEAVPDFALGSATAADESASEALRDASLVDYVGAAAVKLPLFHRLYAAFRVNHLDCGTERALSFRRFQQQGGSALERYATFEALAGYIRGDRQGHMSWRNWPAPYRESGTPETAAFASAHADRVMFHQYLQWEADRQLQVAATAGTDKGMPLGLYRDLALGVDPDGADAWAEQRLLAQGISTGAPPDPFNLKGQSWGLPPFNPHALRDAGYRPFVECLRANMRHAGALRIDHILGLARLFWIPGGAAPSEGGYVRYPLEDLLAIAALESERARCILVGEDLGTVPEGLRERLRAKRVLSTRLLYFERDGDAFRPAQAYPELAHVAVSTHDLPTLPGYWRERDILTRAALRLLPDANGEAELRQERAKARAALLHRLRDAGLPSGIDASAEINDADMDELVDAAYRFLAAAPARLLVVQIEDVLGLEEQSNLPGTVDEHPNWRRKLPRPWEELVTSARLTRFAEMLRRLRP